jgi:hypothetical protein
VLCACQAPARGCERVHPRHRHLRVMAAGAQAEFFTLVERRLHDSGWRAEKFDAVGAALLDFAQPLPAVLWRVDRLDHVVDSREIGVGKQPGCGDRVVFRALLLVDHPAEAVHRAHFAHSSDAVGEPELVDVIDRGHPAIGGMIGDAGMSVAIDKARRHPFAAAIDLMVGRLARARTIAGDLLQADNTAILDNDVDWSDRRGAGAVDHGGAAKREPLEWSDAAIARGRLGDNRDLALVADSRQLIAGGNFRLRLINHGAFPLPSASFPRFGWRPRRYLRR